jgi:pyruvate,water dikinase
MPEARQPWTPRTCARWPQAGAEIRAMVEAQPFPADLEKAIREAFATLSAGNPAASFAVRSSATAEDLPDASFAGQQETFLNVTASTTCCTR